MPWRAFACGMICAVAMLGAQALTVSANYNGNWTALFCTGALIPPSPLVEEEHIYRFPESNGYDGQFYHLIAHDPLLRHGLKQYVDAPRLRYTRILVPGLAWLIAGGKQDRIDVAYRAVILLCAFAGAFWMSLAAARRGWSSWWGIAFLAFPATVTSADRLTVDVALAALSVAFLLQAESPRWGVMFAILAAATLCRETGLLFPLAYGIATALRRNWRGVALAGAALLPYLAWAWYVYGRTEQFQFPLTPLPGSEMLHAILHPARYAEWQQELRFLDDLALAAVVIAFIAAIRQSRNRWTEPVSILALLYVAVAFVVQRDEVWSHVYAYGRFSTPLLLLAFLRGFSFPVWMMLPRILAQLTPQFLGILSFYRFTR